MGSKLDLERLRKDKKFEKANELLQCIIERHCPDNKLLEGLYGARVVKELKNIIEIFLKNNQKYFLIPRKHKLNAPTKIYDARSAIESNKIYREIHTSLLMNKLPEIKHLNYFFGNYSECINNIFDLYIRSGLKRKCELPASTHLNRVGAVVFQMGMNDPNSYKYSTIAVLHDSIEDLLDYALDDDGIPLGILNYKNFLVQYLPVELQSSIKILTNHYDIIIKFIVDKLKIEDKSISKKNILSVLKFLSDLKLEELNVYIDKMTDLIDSTDLDKENDLIIAAKWACYKNLYIDNIAESSNKRDDYRLFEIKGIDLSDNSHGKDALSIDSKIKNIVKNTLWGKKGFALHSTWLPLNQHIEEILEDSLYAAEFIVLKDFLEEQSSLDFVMSALYKFEKLDLIFYD
jgi:hypothetical protein